MKSDEKFGERFQETVSLQSTIKGEKGLDEFHFEVANYRQEFPIDCVRDVLPEQCSELPEVETTTEQKLQDRETQDSLERNLKDVDIVEDILDQTDEAMAKNNNQKLLQEAKKDRIRHQKEAQEIKAQKRVAQLREIEIQRQIDGKYQRIADEILEKILPTTIEILAEREAQMHISKVVNNFDKKARSCLDSRVVQAETVKRCSRQNIFKAFSFAMLKLLVTK